MWQETYGRFVAVWAVVSQTALLLQVIQIYQTKKTDCLSLAAFIVLGVSQIIWFIYGMWAKGSVDVPIVLAASLAFVLVLLILIGMAIYP